MFDYQNVIWICIIKKLNIFATKGIDALREVTPMTMLVELLNNPRYNAMTENVSDWVAMV